MILRSDFGVGSGQWADTLVVGDEVKIRMGIEAYRSDTTVQESR